mmetsp:Transcript_30799/g.77927  ORF Transcript_30799/g.77927 Transcript_30799/m.77927 type:complete len:277 (-) Transcript_30799:4109-4939(-)
MPHAKCAVPFTRQQARTPGWSGSRFRSRGGRTGVCGVAGRQISNPGFSDPGIGINHGTRKGFGWGVGGGKPHTQLLGVADSLKPCTTAPGSEWCTVRAVERSRKAEEGWSPGKRPRNGHRSRRRFRPPLASTRGPGGLQGIAEGSAGERCGRRPLRKAGRSGFGGGRDRRGRTWMLEKTRRRALPGWILAPKSWLLRCQPRTLLPEGGGRALQALWWPHGRGWSLCPPVPNWVENQRRCSEWERLHRTNFRVDPVNRNALDRAVSSTEKRFKYVSK